MLEHKPAPARSRPNAQRLELICQREIEHVASSRRSSRSRVSGHEVSGAKLPVAPLQGERHFIRQFPEVTGPTHGVLRATGTLQQVAVTRIISARAEIEDVFIVCRGRHNQLRPAAPGANAVDLPGRLGCNRLQNGHSLQYAALESWKTAAEMMPEELTLESLSFEKGQNLRITGTTSLDDQARVTAFTEELSKVVVKGQPLFSRVALPSMTVRGANVVWTIVAELKRTDLR